MIGNWYQIIKHEKYRLRKGLDRRLKLIYQLKNSFMLYLPK